MLGNKDEYLTVDGVVYGSGGQPDGNVMNNSANPPEPKYYQEVADAAGGLLAGACATVERGAGVG